ncbi:MAG: hypothetical protein ACI8UO_002787 [Verrucomicrobiales bacterium]|jgi:hypothetical protein
MADSNSKESRRNQIILRIILVISAILILLLYLFGCFSKSDLVMERFDADSAGWKVEGDAEESAGDPEYHAEGGNPGGCLLANDETRGGVWNWSAPDHFRAEFAEDVLANRDEPDLRMVFDLKQSDATSPFEYANVILNSKDLELTYLDGEPPKTDWTSYQIPLNASAWRIKSGEEVPTEKQFVEVLRNLEKILVRGEFREGEDVGQLDNIGLRIVD